MATISDVSIINSNTAEAKPVEAGFERTICGESLCGSKTLTVYRRTVLEGRRFTTQARDDYHLVYVMETSKKGLINFNNLSFCIIVLRIANGIDLNVESGYLFFEKSHPRSCLFF